MLTFPQMQRVAELTSNPGYAILLDAVQAYIDDLTQELVSSDPVKEQQTLGKWRAAKDIFVILKTQPEELAIECMKEEAGKVNEIVTRVAPVIHPPLPTERLFRMKKLYEERTKELNKE